MLRVINFLAVPLVIFAAFLLYWIKNETRRKVAFLDVVRREIAAEQATLAVLKAEWSYLVRPDRLQRLSDHYLDLQILDMHQIVSLRDLEKVPWMSSVAGRNIRKDSRLAQAEGGSQAADASSATKDSRLTQPEGGSEDPFDGEWDGYLMVR